MKFKCSDLVKAEYKRRATTQCVNRMVSRNTFCVFKQERIDGVENAEVKIEKYNHVMNCFEETIKISMGKRICFEVVLQKNKALVLGGYESTEALKSVSINK